jgi:ribosome-binding factor A
MAVDLFLPERRKGFGKRNDRVAAQMRECLAKELARGDFPAFRWKNAAEQNCQLPQPVTISFIDLSRDLKNATVYFMPLGGAKKEETEKFLSIQTSYFKKIIAKNMFLKFVPNLRFKLDSSFEYSTKIDSLLKKT